jgi:hypothetical protein
MYYEQVVLNRFSPEIPLCSVESTGASHMSSPPTQLRYKKGARLRRRSRQGQQKLYRNKKKRGSCLRGPELEFFATIRQGARHWARHLIFKKTVRTALFIASVAAAVANERVLTPGLFVLRMEYRICS